MEINPRQKDLLADSILLALTYWIPFSELFEPDRMEDSSAQVRAISRVLLLVTPHLREPEKGQLTSLAYGYLEHVE
jgi:hypothetical protein